MTNYNPLPNFGDEVINGKNYFWYREHVYIIFPETRDYAIDYFFHEVKPDGDMVYVGHYGTITEARRVIGADHA